MAVYRLRWKKVYPRIKSVASTAARLAEPVPAILMEWWYYTNPLKAKHAGHRSS